MQRDRAAVWRHRRCHRRGPGHSTAGILASWGRMAAVNNATNAITGFYPPNVGTIRLAGEDITGTAPHKVAKLGCPNVQT